jgi:hypothetical protein
MEIRLGTGFSRGQVGASERFHTFSSSRDSGAWSTRAEKNVPGANTFAVPELVVRHLTAVRRGSHRRQHLRSPAATLRS